ncbi:sigma-54-dependent Fis family transcriptional re gulator [Desulfonema ishimotonii]|uniref:Sigma-54-dependent Fis family transcriptional re gulator n=1 Tax=Desulfonema ishimotonii TaxID=45657 RepID=A0A401FWR6_9BACT|nr:sigma 54-interacting transcriptional regulator [Desulfonema ishimotonii]GBC61417.1 sigma-54-dependent Fis family transcriptional re gulator [Desulfonema ishimotonii]
MITPDIIRLFPDVDPATFSFLPVLDQLHEGVMITDNKGIILYMNDIQAKIDDLIPSDVIGRKVTDVYHVDEGVSPTMQCIKSGQRIDNLACFYRTRLGKVVNSLHNIFPLNASGQLIGTICFIRDYGIIEQTLESVSRPEKRKDIRRISSLPAAPEKKRLRNGTRFTFEDIIGEMPEFLQAIESARLASDSPSSVMLFGETGTGKELLAQSIHNNSSRHSQQYVAVNCAAIPENLLEGILFGTAKGAFTGAMDKAGLFEKASGGTLFLDEINSMSVGLQAKLLRVLQERKVRRVGSLDEIAIDLKLISSVNENPHRAIRQGTFRADLLYRLGVVFIRIPPLREHKEDLEKLICHFLSKYNDILKKNVNAISSEVMALFESYDWPGNVRELEHVIEGAMNLAGTRETIQVRHLAVHIGGLSPTGPDPSAPPATDGSSDGEDTSQTPQNRGRVNIVFPSAQASPKPDKSLSEIQKQNEIETIRAALTKARGNAARAARQLKISPQLLHYKLKRYGIDAKAFKL